MLGFADIADNDMLTLEQIATRCGYSRSSSLRRALNAMGLCLPHALFRGRYRGDVVKAWYAALPLRADADKHGGRAKAPADLDSPAAQHSPAPPGVVSLEDARSLQQDRARLKARISAI